jgi:hypothetical protein
MNSTESNRDFSISNLAPLTLDLAKMEGMNKNCPERNEKIKSRRSFPSPTPVQSNPIFQHQFGKPSPIRQRRGSFLYKQDSSSNIGDVISPKLSAAKNLSLPSNDDFIITPFAQLLAKLR